MLNVDPHRVSELMKRFDKNESAFYKKFGGGRSTKYDLVGRDHAKDRRYPPAAIAQAALGVKDVRGGWSSADAACQILRRAGFTIVNKSGEPTAGPDRPSKVLDQLEARLAKIKVSSRLGIVKQRIGQSLLKAILIERYQGRCEVTGIADEALLRASHVVAWHNGTIREQLDIDNTVLLSAMWDAAFDKGLISFSVDGRALVSKKLSSSALSALAPSKAKSLVMNDQRNAYMARHRNEHGFS